MRESASPGHHAWARLIARRYAQEFPQDRHDIEAEAIAGLVDAERHPSCPRGDDSDPRGGDDEFRAFAFGFVRGSVTNYTRILRRHRRILFDVEARVEFDLIPDARTDPPGGGWGERRLSIAGKFDGIQKAVFLAIYGEVEYRTFSRVAAEFGLSLDQVKRLHRASLEVLRDLPGIYRVA